MEGALTYRRLLPLFFALALTGCFNRAPIHGTKFTLEVDTLKCQTEQDRQHVLDATLQTLKKRMDRFGARFSVEVSGTNLITLRVGTMDDTALSALRQTVLRGGLLEFCLVQEPSSMLSAEVSGPGDETVSLKRALPGGQIAEEKLIIKRPAALTGGVKSAMAMRDSLDRPQVAFELDPQATRSFAKLTRENINRRLAVVVDGEVRTAPVIRSEIAEGRGVIEGDFDLPVAVQIAAVLEAPLPAVLKIVLEETF